MKKIILISTLFICSLRLAIFSVKAQTLYGSTPDGGNEGGTITKFIPATNNLIVVQSFESLGDAYGVIFSFDPFFSNYTKLKDFDLYQWRR